MSDIEIKDLKDRKNLSDEEMARTTGGATLVSKSTLFDKTKVEKPKWSWGTSSLSFSNLTNLSRKLK